MEDDTLAITEGGNAMSYTVASDTCEGCGDCIRVCPEECIHWVEGMTNAKGTKYVFIDNMKCTDCGACAPRCPIYGAVRDTWQPELQHR